MRIGTEKVTDHVRVVVEPGKPRLHPVEELAVGVALPLLATPGGAFHQLFGPIPHGHVGDQLTARKDLDPFDGIGRSLVGNGEFGEPVDFVTPQVDPHRCRGRRRVHVDDRAPDSDVPPMLDLHVAPIAHRDELLHELLHVEPVAGPNDEWLALHVAWRQPLEQRPDRNREHLGGPTVAQLPQQTSPASHRVDARADPLERQRLPGGEDLGLVLSDPGAQVGRQPVGGLARRRDHDDRPTLAGLGDRGEQERMGRLGAGQIGPGAAQHPDHGRVVGQQMGKLANRHRSVVEAVHHRVGGLGQQGLGRVRSSFDDIVEQVAIFSPRTLEHPVGAPEVLGRPPDPDAEPEELGALEMVPDRAEPVVAGEPSAHLEPQTARFEIELVVHDDETSEILDAVAPDQWTNRLA